MSEFTFDDNQLFISHELLKALEWLTKHELETLKKLLSKALVSSHYIHQNKHSTEDLHITVIEFFNILDGLLHSLLNENEVEVAMQRSRIPAIKHIDTSMYDQTSVNASIVKATSALGKHKTLDAQEVLFKELLRRWKPNKKPLAN
jgi:hypothetical protein